MSERLGKEPACPDQCAGGRRFLDERKDPTVDRLVVLAWLAGLGHILEPSQTGGCEAGAPFRDPGGPHPQRARDLLGATPFGSEQDDTGSLRPQLELGSIVDPGAQSPSILRG
ncbi:MAG TPA: hypothetical protein VKT49_12095 [Bryobacteraceae bacterium]|nr:hypothetical protein [Bryobacteraceae bacterium]